MTTICYCYNISELSDPSLFNRAMEALPWEERRRKVLRFRPKQERMRCLGAGLLAAFALRSAGAEDLRMSCGPQGKPELAAHPDIHFNVSHSGSLAVCAVSDAPVGVDVEHSRKILWGVVRRFFRPEEQEWLERSPDPDRDFTRLWTRKESFLKRSGEGLSRPMDSFCVLPDMSAENQAVFSEIIQDGHYICVCSGTGEAVFKRWSLL